MDIRCIAIPADHNVNGKENGRGAVERDTLKQQSWSVHQQDEARARGDSELEIRLIRHVEFSNDAEARVQEQPPDLAHSLPERFRNDPSVASGCDIHGRTFLVHFRSGTSVTISVG
jgi:hypothetical protein